MKVQVTVKDLPNGSVPFQSIADSNTRNTIMLTNENVVDTGKRCKMLEKAVVELQKNPGGVDDSALQQAVAQANAAKDAAGNSATEAGNSATAAAASAVLAANANIIAFRVYGKDIGENAGTETFYLADFGLSDTSKTYLVRAAFTNESSTARSVKLNGSGTPNILSGGVGNRCVLFCTVAGAGSFTIDNVDASVNVTICIKINS